MNIFQTQSQELIQVLQLMNQTEQTEGNIEKVISLLVDTFRSGCKVLFCGNGGSAAQAQHLAAELSGKFKLDRRAIPAEACHVNSSFTTAVSNDYGYNKVFARHVEAFGNKGDVLIGLSTSGQSANVVEALKSAREKGMTTIAFTGNNPSTMQLHSDILLRVPSTSVPHIQEIHLLIGHIICEEVENRLFCL